MSTPIISVRGLGKEYWLGGVSHDTLRDQLSHAASKLVGRFRKGLRATGEESASGPESFWALKDVDFDVQSGEVVGIIGRNGAGKSTLLKILSQITEPTEGEVRMRGRVASLLEVGTGFHPELSGRENIYLNGAILGMTKAEIKRKFDEIVSFAEVEKFLDTPVKHYSSGMYVRLAFAVAAHLEPEILIVDEVLAVGDAQFQKKCLGKMGTVAKTGRTVLFVSHNMTALSTICGTSVWLDSGRVAYRGGVQDGIDRYLDTAKTRTNRLVFDPPSDTILRFLSVSLAEPANGSRLYALDEPIHVRIKYEAVNEVKRAQVICHIWTAQRVHVAALSDIDLSPELFESRAPGIYETEVVLPPNLFGQGTYQVELACSFPDVHVIDQQEGPYFEVTGANTYAANWSSGRRNVIISTPLPWRTTVLGNSDSSAR